MKQLVGPHSACFRPGQGNGVLRIVDDARRLIHFGGRGSENHRCVDCMTGRRPDHRRKLETAFKDLVGAGRGGDPFNDYQVPLATLTLLQGLGRLIRTRADRGVLAVLDPRLRGMRYGRRFLASLPPAPLTDDLAVVGRFFGGA